MKEKFKDGVYEEKKRKNEAADGAHNIVADIPEG